jgi:RHS repeat-associated protein
MRFSVSERLNGFEVSTGVESPLTGFTGKEQDEETGFYYYGARYLNPKTSMWIIADPAVSDYIPKAPVDDEAKKHNENLPSMGGVFTYQAIYI